MPTYQLIIEVKGKDNASGTLKGVNDAFEKLTGVSLGGAGALAALGAGLKYSIDQAAEAEQIMAQTAAAIKSTGGAAGLSAHEISNMAQALSDNSTFADDAIQRGQNLLLTFTGIGKDVFPEATQAMLDMATAMGTDASSGAIQLGKALNDPTQGITALTRVGVVFTDKQKKLIKSLQDAGDMAGAQKVILAELNKEFGGSAAAQVGTYAGKMKQLQNNIDNLAEEVGGALIPVLSDAVGALNLLVTWNSRVEGALEAHETEVRNTAQSYTEYREEMLRANEAAGKFHTEIVSGTGAGRGYDVVTQQVTDTTNILSEAMWQAVRVTGEDERGMRDLSLAVAQVADEEEILKAKQDALKQAMQDLNTIMAGPIKAENDAYYEKQKETGASLAEVKAELDKLTAQQGKSYTVVTEATNTQAEYELALQKSAEAALALAENTDPEKTLSLTVAAEKAAEKADAMAKGLGGVSTGIIDNKTKIEELKGKYSDLQAAYADEQAAHKERTAGIVFDLLSQKVLADGVQDGDITFLAEIGKAWGLYDAETAAAMKAVESAVTEHGTNARLVLEELNNTALALPNVDRYINYHITTTGSVPYGAEPGGEAPVIVPDTDTGAVYGGAQAAGGDYMVSRPTWFLAGEAGPERATFTPQGKAGPGNTIINNYNLSVASLRSTESVANDFAVQRILAGA